MTRENRKSNGSTLRLLWLPMLAMWILTWPIANFGAFRSDAAPLVLSDAQKVKLYKNIQTMSRDLATSRQEAAKYRELFALADAKVRTMSADLSYAHAQVKDMQLRVAALRTATMSSDVAGDAAYAALKTERDFWKEKAAYYLATIRTWQRTNPFLVGAAALVGGGAGYWAGDR